MFFLEMSLKADYKVLKRGKHSNNSIQDCFQRALFTTKSEFLMRDRVLHISHNAALS